MTLIRYLLTSCPYLSYQATHVHCAFNCLGWTCTSTPPVNIRALYMTAMTLIRYLLTSCPYLSYQTTHMHCAFDGGHRWVSNPRPPDCQSGVLPAELLAHNISQTFSPVSYHKTNFRSTTACKSDSLFTRGEVVDPPSSVKVK